MKIQTSPNFLSGITICSVVVVIGTTALQMYLNTPGEKALEFGVACGAGAWFIITFIIIML